MKALFKGRVTLSGQEGRFYSYFSGCGGRNKCSFGISTHLRDSSCRRPRTFRVPPSPGRRARSAPRPWRTSSGAARSCPCPARRSMKRSSAPGPSSRPVSKSKRTRSQSTICSGMKPAVGLNGLRMGVPRDGSLYSIILYFNITPRWIRAGIRGRRMPPARRAMACGSGPRRTTRKGRA